MKRLSLVFRMSALAFAALCVTSLAAGTQTIEASAHGEARRTETGELILQGRVHGDVTGTVRITLKWDGEPRAVGHFELVTTAATGDEMPVETGSIRGRVLEGEFTSGHDGSVVALTNLALSLSEGTGDYASINGSGRVDVRLGRDSEPFVAKLVLAF